MTTPRTPSAGAIPPTLAAALRDRFPLERELGQGGMATVYLADDLRHGRKVAVKVLRPEIALLLGRERFEREVRLASSLNHPHIVPVYDSGEAAGFLYFVMPAVDGESLSARLGRERYLSLDDAVRVLVEVSEALDFAHLRGIVHRDIKPGNILLSGGHALVADFGIALALSKVDGERLTETGLSMGTPAYMSPEQAAGHRDMDGRTDQYSLACVLYEMLGGEPPFAGSTPRSVMARQLADPPPPLATLRPGLPQRVEGTVQRALAKIPVDRYESVGAFARAVSQAASDTSAPAAPAVARSRRRWGRVAVGVAVTAGLVTAAVLVRQWLTKSEPITSIAVLPPENLAHDSTLEFMVDGVHEHLITALAQARHLRIKPRTAVRPFWTAERSIPAVVRGLGVDAVLETSILPSRDSVRVSVRLVRGSSQDIVWAGDTVVGRADVLRLSGTMARAIVDAADIGLSRAEESRLASARAVDPEAFELVQKAAYSGRSEELPALQQARVWLRQATEKDGTYSEAWSSLARVLVKLTQYGGATPAEVTAQAVAAAHRAIQLDSASAVAWQTLAYVEFWVNWDYAAADRAGRRATELGGLTLPADFLLLTGRFDDAIREFERLAREDPLSAQNSINVGWALFNARRYEESLRALRRTVASHPEIAGFATEEIAWNYSMLGAHDSAVSAMRRAFPDTAESRDIVTLFGATTVFARAGLRAQARRRLAELVAVVRDPRVSPWELMNAYLAMGDDADALRLLERVYQERWPSMMFARVDPFMSAEFRALPRVQEILRLAGAAP